MDEKTMDYVDYSSRKDCSDESDCVECRMWLCASRGIGFIVYAIGCCNALLKFFKVTSRGIDLLVYELR